MKEDIFSSVDSYIGKLFKLDDDDALRATEKSIEESNIPSISISPNQGRFLNILAHLCQAGKILEIGTLAGYSTIWLARALPSSGRMVTLEINPRHAKVAAENIKRAGLSSKVDIRTGQALELLPQIQKEGLAPFDMIFIDADKPPYAEYFEWALKLSRPGTLIIADNVIRKGEILDGATTDDKVTGAQRFNKILASNKSVIATIVQTVGVKGHDGMAIAIVK